MNAFLFNLFNKDQPTSVIIFFVPECLATHLLLFYILGILSQKKKSSWFLLVAKWTKVASTEYFLLL